MQVSHENKTISTRDKILQNTVSFFAGNFIIVGATILWGLCFLNFRFFTGLSNNWVISITIGLVLLSYLELIKFFVFLQFLYVIKITLRVYRFKPTPKHYIKPKIAIVSLLLTCILLFGSATYRSAVTKYATLETKYGKYQLKTMKSGLFENFNSHDEIVSIGNYYYPSEKYNLEDGQQYKNDLFENRVIVIKDKTKIEIVGDNTDNVLNDRYFEVLEGEYYDNIGVDNRPEDEETSVVKKLTIKKVDVKAVGDRDKIERSKLRSFDYSLIARVDSNYFSRETGGAQDDFYIFEYNERTNEVTNKTKITIPQDAIINFDKTKIEINKKYYIKTIKLNKYNLSGEYFVKALEI